MPNVLEISLFDPGMTVLHRAGLAGLWMTLEALDNDGSLRKRLASHGCWKKDNKSVTLSWEDGKFFQELFAISFQVDKNGLFHFPALGDPVHNLQHAVVLQEAILNTVLQHGKTRKSDKSGDPKGEQVFEVDGNSYIVKYHRVQKYAHQHEVFDPTEAGRLVGWLYPGGGTRHVGFGNATDLDNPPGLALALRYLMIGSIYFEIRRRGGGVRPRYAMVIPEITDLAVYARARELFLRQGVQRLIASGSAEAGLRVLLELKAQNLVEDLAGQACRVFSFGTVPWASQQKTRVQILEIQVDKKCDLHSFRAAQQVFGVKPVKSAEWHWDVPQVPDLVAGNTIGRRPWWWGFADFVADQERRDHVFHYEKGGLAKMVADEKVFPEGPERIFVEACHEAWRRRLGQLAERAREKNISFPDLARREFERYRVAFSRCKNAASVRAAVTDFWSRSGGSLPKLREGWKEVIAMFEGKEWQKARDLALLALASYKPADRDEESALDGLA